MNMKTQVPCAALFAALIFAAKKEVLREDIMTVCIDGAHVVGTDGHRLLRITLSPAPLEAGQPEILIPRGDLERLRKALTATQRREAICTVTKRRDGSQHAYDLDVGGTTVQGTWQNDSAASYPDFDTVIPVEGYPEKRHEAQGLNASYLGDMAKVAVAFGAKIPVTVIQTAGHGELEPSRWRLTGPQDLQIGNECEDGMWTVEEAMAVIMPCRT